MQVDIQRSQIEVRRRITLSSSHRKYLLVFQERCFEERETILVVALIPMMKYLVVAALLYATLIERKEYMLRYEHMMWKCVYNPHSRSYETLSILTYHRGADVGVNAVAAFVVERILQTDM